MQGIRTARSHPISSGVASDAEYILHTVGAPSLDNGRHVQLVPEWTHRRKGRAIPLIVRVNRILRTALVTLCGMALLGYGLDVASSNEVGKLEAQARRLSEQNTELSAQLLRAISFQGIQANVAGRAGLRPPEQVSILPEVPPPPMKPFKPKKHYLPLQAGY